MNEELTKRLSVYLDELEKTLSKTGDFVVEQAPQVVKEFLAWEFWSSVIWACIFILEVIVLVYVSKLVSKSKFWNETLEEDMDAPITKTIISCICLAFFLLLGISGVQNALHATKVSVAPRVVLLEKTCDLLKSNKK